MTGILHRYIQGCYYVINPTLLELYRAIILAQKHLSLLPSAFILVTSAYMHNCEFHDTQLGRFAVNMPASEVAFCDNAICCGLQWPN